MDQIIIKSNKWYHHYDNYKSKKEAVEDAKHIKNITKGCQYTIILAVEGVIQPKKVFRLYLTKVFRPKIIA